MVLDPIPQSLPVHFFGSRPQPPTSPHASNSRDTYTDESWHTYGWVMKTSGFAGWESFLFISFLGGEMPMNHLGPNESLGTQDTVLHSPAPHPCPPTWSISFSVWVIDSKSTTFTENLVSLPDSFFLQRRTQIFWKPDIFFPCPFLSKMQPLGGGMIQSVQTATVCVGYRLWDSVADPLHGVKTVYYVQGVNQSTMLVCHACSSVWQML